MDYVSLIKSWKLNAVIKDRKTPVPETRFLLSAGYSHLVFFLDQLLGYLEKHVYGYEK